MPQKKSNGKRSSKSHAAPSNRRVRIPADQRALGRWGYRCIWTPAGYKAVPTGSNAR